MQNNPITQALNIHEQELFDDGPRRNYEGDASRQNSHKKRNKVVTQAGMDQVVKIKESSTNNTTTGSTG